MKYRRKIFSAADVAAIRDGRKTMFREMVVPQPPTECVLTRMQDGFSDGIRPVFGLHDEPNAFSAKSPFGTIGDRIWIPEAWAYEGVDGSSKLPVQYKADRSDWIKSSRWRSAAVMHRDVCRTFAEITAVRVERVADITEEDARKEGIMESEAGRAASKALATYKRQDKPPPVLQFADLWQSRCGKWDANPFVWVYSIKLIKP